MDKTSGDGLTSQDHRQWHYQLDPGTFRDEIPMLVQMEPSRAANLSSIETTSRPPPVRNKPAVGQNGFFRSVANLGLTQTINRQPDQAGSDVTDGELLQDYDNLFRTFYNYAPILDAINITSAYLRCKHLLGLADKYDALEVVGPRVDHHLLQFQGRLWKQVAKYAPSYLKLGYMARSKVIFAEALIHVVGQWPIGERHLRGHVPQHVLEIIEEKVDELEEMRARAESKLFRLNLVTSRGDKVTPANSYSDWLAVSLFRQWVADNTTFAPQSASNSVHQSSRNGAGSGMPVQPVPVQPTSLGRTYRLLGQAGSAYLGHDECKRFLKLTSEKYNRELLKRFENRLDDLKILARDIVRPLLRDGLELEHSNAVLYLTCIRVEERDFPWEVL